MTGVLHIVVAMKPVECGFAENAIIFGVAGLNMDGCRVITDESTVRHNNSGKGNIENWRTGKKASVTGSILGRWPANVILEASEKLTQAFPETTSGDRDGKHIAGWKDSGATRYEPNDTGNTFAGDTGSAARFFKQVSEYKEETT